MKFLSLAVLAVVALARGEAVQEKRGVVAGQQAYTSQQTYAAPAPASIAYTKVQQPVQKAVVAAPQPQFYSQQAAAPAAYSVPTVQQQYQYQPQAQAVAYAQPALAKYAAAPADAAKVAAYRPQFSLANDVSSFTYSSPVVTYNNLGLLSQVVGKIANPGQQAKVAAAPGPVAYQAQAPVQKVAYPQPSPVAYAAPAQLQQAKYAIQAQQPQRLLAAAPQQYFSQVPQQQAYAAAPQAAYHQQAQAQAYTSQSVPQSLYSQAPQYYNAAQQVKQVNPGVSYAQ